MIEAEFVFVSGEVERVALSLRTLSSQMRPVRFGSGDEEGELVEDPRLSAFLENRNSGFVLTARDATYHFRVAPKRNVTCYCYFQNEDEVLLQEFVEHMAEASPIFGYACRPEERKWRNRLYVKLENQQTLESWVGRDPLKYIPGLYWFTVISEELAQQHGVPMEDIACEAVLVQSNGVTRALRFYQHPDDWLEHRQRVDQLCAKYKGIFLLSTVHNVLKGESNFLKLEALLANWR